MDYLILDSKTLDFQILLFLIQITLFEQLGPGVITWTRHSFWGFHNYPVISRKQKYFSPINEIVILRNHPFLYSWINIQENKLCNVEITALENNSKSSRFQLRTEHYPPHTRMILLLSFIQGDTRLSILNLTHLFTQQTSPVLILFPGKTSPLCNLHLVSLWICNSNLSSVLNQILSTFS